ncbi:conserved hypothetical protein [Candida albicans WO-1]|uniref:Uncharacterized protein n=2 Tax=Candida albicans TaxID=5476 RepID=Q5A7K5_CANAL|nr:uncharacterized protein CAALFM_C300150WA [Candida albicans SC5314]AOW28065.1 hypothetical protein CAALFM_C300150WA [Candida albicans SC5314]EEQ44089.1 conserved hypothetical protein [Candida albicans WO-1]|eukprot:XP_717832.1 hypothetical protein CAALFM_C300150WA [Candida albicans SC5314]
MVACFDDGVNTAAFGFNLYVFGSFLVWSCCFFKISSCFILSLAKIGNKSCGILCGILKLALNSRNELISLCAFNLNDSFGTGGFGGIDSGFACFELDTIAGSWWWCVVVPCCAGFEISAFLNAAINSSPLLSTPEYLSSSSTPLSSTTTPLSSKMCRSVVACCSISLAILSALATRSW